MTNKTFYGVPFIHMVSNITVTVFIIDPNVEVLY